MGAIISIIYFSKENLYQDDIDNTDNIDKYEFTHISNNENNVSVASTTTDWINFNNSRTYEDVGVTFVDSIVSPKDLKERRIQYIENDRLFTR